MQLEAREKNLQSLIKDLKLNNIKSSSGDVSNEIEELQFKIQKLENQKDKQELRIKELEVENKKSLK